MAFPSVKSYAAVDPITSLTIVPIGAIFHPPRVNQGPARGSWIYNFFTTGTSTPKNVYQDGNLTTPFAPTGQVTADAFGRFPAIYLDNTVAYKVTLSNAAAVVQQTRDPYNPAMATTGQAQIAAAQGIIVNAQGEITLTEAGAGGTGIELSITAGLGGALTIQGITPGVATLIADNTVTTGAQTATFAATNMPPSTNLQNAITFTGAPAGTITTLTLTAAFTGITASVYSIVLSTGQVILNATLTNGSTAVTFPSTTITGAPTVNAFATFNTGVAGWLPVQADSVLYYTPIFHASAFTPYVFKGNTYQGQVISVVSSNFASGGVIKFNGDGSTTLSGDSGISANPANYYNPPQAGIGASSYINITTTFSQAGNTFSAAAGAFTNIGSGGLVISMTRGAGDVVGELTGTYQLSTSVGGTPVVANGTIIMNPLSRAYGGGFGTGGSFTETVPTGNFTSVIVELWGSAGGGSGTTGSKGNQGGSGSYSRSVYTLAALGGAGKTFTITLANGGNPGTINVNSAGSNGATPSSIVAGTVTGFTSMTVNPGAGGPAGTGASGGVGGTAGTGGTASNLAGVIGIGGLSGGTGAVPQVSANQVAGAPEGVSGVPAGEGGFGQLSAGTSGQTGAAAGALFTYI